MGVIAIINEILVLAPSLKPLLMKLIAGFRSKEYDPEMAHKYLKEFKSLDEIDAGATMPPEAGT